MILSSNILSLLTAQYSHETANGIFYTALQSWADRRGLTGTASFFRKQAEGERVHADKILEYIHNRNDQLTVIAVPLQAVEPTSFENLFTLAIERERLTSEMILAIKSQAESIGDHATCQWLLDPEGLVKEQVEEENILQTIIDRMNIDPTAGPHLLDVWIGGL